MPNTKSAKKALRKSRKRYEENRRFKARLKRWIKKLQLLVADAQKEYAEKTFPMVQKLLDKAAKKHIYHKNKVNRIKSRLHKQVASLGAEKTTAKK